MNQVPPAPPPYTCKHDFFAHGLAPVVLAANLDCSICREPLAICDPAAASAPLQLPRVESTCRTRISANQDSEDAVEARYRTASTQTTLNDPFPHSTHTASATNPAPEIPTQIRPCGHIFGSTCLKTWFTSTSANLCPLCNHVLFPKKAIRLGLREPTRAMRAEFADYIEHCLGDRDTAIEIREQLMGGWVRFLMRELAVEVHRGQGFEVTWEYVDRDSEGRLIEDEDDCGAVSDEEMDSGSEYEEMDSGTEYEEMDSGTEYEEMDSGSGYEEDGSGEHEDDETDS